MFAGTFKSYVPVTLTSDRAGLVMETGAKVKLRGVQVGRVSQRQRRPRTGVSLKLEIDPDQIQYIPANVEAQIRATTAFGAKFVDLVYPDDPEPAAAGRRRGAAVANVSTEVNTVFENVVDLLNMIDPAKLNAVLTALAEGVRGQGERIGQATTDAQRGADWRSTPRSETIRAGLALVQGLQRHLRRGRPRHPDGPRRRQHHQRHGHQSRQRPGYACCST